MIQATELAEDLSGALRTLDTVPMRRPEPVATEWIESAQPPVARDAWLSEIDSRPALCYGLTEHNLARLAAGWARTGATPPAVAGLLAEARRLWVGGAAVYDNFTAASLKALHASEQALRVRLAVPDTKRVMLGQLVQGPDVLAALGYDLYRLGWFRQFAVRFRNDLSHPHQTKAFTPGMAEGFLASAHDRVAELFPGPGLTAGGRV